MCIIRVNLLSIFLKTLTLALSACFAFNVFIFAYKNIIVIILFTNLTNGAGAGDTPTQPRAGTD